MVVYDVDRARELVPVKTFDHLADRLVSDDGSPPI